MPRIEQLANYDASSGDGSPTIDVCRACAVEFKEGQSGVGAVDVDHPSYADPEFPYECDECGRQLTRRDD